MSVTGFISAVAKETGTSSKHIDYSNYASTVQKNDCYLCGNNPDSQITPHLGEENLGLINLNTFECMVFEVNRYTASGERIELVEKYSVFRSRQIEEGDGTRVSYEVDKNRGVLCAHLSFRENSDLILENIQKYLCADCLDAVMEEYWPSERHWDTALIDFKSGEIEPFSPYDIAKNISDYRAAMEYDPEYDSLRLIAFYAPTRYSELGYDPNLSIIDEILLYCKGNDFAFSINDEVAEFLDSFEMIASIREDEDSVSFFDNAIYEKKLTIYKDGTYDIFDFDKLTETSSVVS